MPQRLVHGRLPSAHPSGTPGLAQAVDDALTLREIGRIVARRACAEAPYSEGRIERVERYCGNVFPVSGQDLGATRPTQTDGINRVGESLSSSATRTGRRSAISILRKSPADNQRPSYSPGTRRGARRSTSPSCRSCCGGSNKRHKRFGRSTRIFRRRTI